MALTAQETELAAELIVLMKKHGLTEHVEGDLRISVVAVDEKVKVKKIGGEEE